MTTSHTPNVWVLVVATTFITFGLRASFLLSIDRVGGLPPRLARAMPFVPTVVLAALVAPNVFINSGGLALGFGNERLIAGIAAFGIAWYTESMFATVGIGMVVLWMLV
jgi:branched-subunit amino acid transport protein